jgi:hypothetical protein
MKEYPSILSAADILSHSEEYLGRPFVAFDKLDGSNIRAEWDRKRSWHLFGSRRRILDASQPLIGQATQLVLDHYGDGLAKVFTGDLPLGRPQQVTAYFEFLGPHSFAGMHDPADLGVPSNEPFRVVLIDVNIHKRGFVAVVHRGVLDHQFIADVRAGRFGDSEGVVCKGGEGHGRWMAKVKTNAYLRRLKEFFSGDWEKYWE